VRLKGRDLCLERGDVIRGEMGERRRLSYVMNKLIEVSRRMD
jgi:hypothetical protein